MKKKSSSWDQTVLLLVCRVFAEQLTDEETHLRERARENETEKERERMCRKDTGTNKCLLQSVQSVQSRLHNLSNSNEASL